MKLLVRNLARTTTEVALKEMFETYGMVQYCTLVTDKDTGASKGFGFVEMPKIGDAKAAMKNLNNQEIDGSKVRVKKAEPKPEEVKKSDVPEPKSKSKSEHKPKANRQSPSVWDRK